MRARGGGAGTPGRTEAAGESEGRGRARSAGTRGDERRGPRDRRDSMPDMDFRKVLSSGGRTFFCAVRGREWMAGGRRTRQAGAGRGDTRQRRSRWRGRRRRPGTGRGGAGTRPGYDGPHRGRSGGPCGGPHGGRMRRDTRRSHRRPERVWAPTGTGLRFFRKGKTEKRCCRTVSGNVEKTGRSRRMSVTSDVTQHAEMVYQLFFWSAFYQNLDV